VYRLLDWADNEGKFVPRNLADVRESPFNMLEDSTILGDHAATFEVVKTFKHYLFYHICVRVCPEIFDDKDYKISETKFRIKATEEYESASALGLIDIVSEKALWAKLVPVFYALIDQSSLSFADKYTYFHDNPIVPSQFT
jgi:hypothetical protein